MMLCIVGANAQDDVVFSASVTATAKVSFEPGTTEITSANAQIVGGKMYAINGQNEAKYLIGNQSGYYMFCMTNNDTFFKVELNKALAVGDVISAKTYTRTDTELGLFISTADLRPNECSTKLSIAQAETAGYESLSDYTVAEGDELVGATTFYIYRETGKSTYFNEFTITRATKTVTFINDAGWENVYVWAWNDSENFTGGSWPGVKMTAVDGEENTYTWSTTGDPTKIIFSNGGSPQTADLDFVNGGKYNSGGRIKTAFSATLSTDLETVYAYVWSYDGETVTNKALGEWPGTQLTSEGGVFNVSFEAEDAPEHIIFHNNAGDQTADLVFENEGAYEYFKSTFTATFTTDADWETVYAYVWSGDGNSANNKALGEWPGKVLEANEGVYTVSFEAYNAPAKIQFNGGDAAKKTPDLTFNKGRAYKWNTTLEPLFALQESATTIPAGTTVNVKDADGDVVATLTYGFEDGAEFAAPTTRANDEYQGFNAYTAGNGQNGTATSGTVYIIKPVYDGEVTVGVWLNAGKSLYIQEDGTSLSGFDGYTADYASGTAFTFPVKAGSEYKVYCTGSKLGFYGFDYKFEKVPYYVIGDNGTEWVALGKMDYFDQMKQYDYTLDKTWTGKYFAIAPASALNADGSVADWDKVLRPKSESGNSLVELRNYDYEVVTGGNNVWEKADDITKIRIVYYLEQQKFYLYPYSEVTISSSGYATYSHKYDYYVGAEASIVKAVNGGEAELQKLELNLYSKGIPGGTGVILKGSPFNYTIYPYEKNDDNEYVDVTGNMLIGSGNSTFNLNADDYTAYLLQTVNGQTGFQKWNGDTATPLAAHKAFLAIPNVTAGAPAFISFGGGTTGIEAATLSQRAGQYYTLDGRRVENPTKGLYIINGKKVVIK